MDEGFAEKSLPYYGFNDTLTNPPIPLLSPPSSVSVVSECLQSQFEASPSMSQPSASPRILPQIPSPPDDASATKSKLSLIWTTFACPYCKDVFVIEALWLRHKRQKDCTAPSSGESLACEACGKVIKSSKDLKRHQGGSRSAPSCPVLKAQAKQLKPFVCTCGNSYSRKDILQRHMNTKLCSPQI